MNAPAKIVASLGWEKINGIRIKMACVTCGTDGAPAPFEPCHYVRKDIADELLEALEDLLEVCAHSVGELDPREPIKAARAAITKAKGESK